MIGGKKHIIQTLHEWRSHQRQACKGLALDNPHYQYFNISFIKFNLERSEGAGELLKTFVLKNCFVGYNCLSL
jgi:hypothetical protein